MSNLELTLSIIKPDAVERKLDEEIKDMFRNKEFNILKEKSSKYPKYFQYPFDAPPLEHYSSYYWKVISFDENGEALGDFSSIATFQTPDGIIELEFIYEEGWE